MHGVGDSSGELEHPIGGAPDTPVRLVQEPLREPLEGLEPPIAVTAQGRAPDPVVRQVILVSIQANDILECSRNPRLGVSLQFRQV